MFNEKLISFITSLVNDEGKFFDNEFDEEYYQSVKKHIKKHVNSLNSSTGTGGLQSFTNDCSNLDEQICKIVNNIECISKGDTSTINQHILSIQKLEKEKIETSKKDELLTKKYELLAKVDSAYKQLAGIVTIITIIDNFNKIFKKILGEDAPALNEYLTKGTFYFQGHPYYSLLERCKNELISVRSLQSEFPKDTAKLNFSRINLYEFIETLYFYSQVYIDFYDRGWSEITKPLDRGDLNKQAKENAESFAKMREDIRADLLSCYESYVDCLDVDCLDKGIKWDLNDQEKERRSKYSPFIDRKYLNEVVDHADNAILIAEGVNLNQEDYKLSYIAISLALKKAGEFLNVHGQRNSQICYLSEKTGKYIKLKLGESDLKSLNFIRNQLAHIEPLAVIINQEEEMYGDNFRDIVNYLKTFRNNINEVLLYTCSLAHKTTGEILQQECNINEEIVDQQERMTRINKQNNEIKMLVDKFEIKDLVYESERIEYPQGLDQTLKKHKWELFDLLKEKGKLQNNELLQKIRNIFSKMRSTIESSTSSNTQYTGSPSNTIKDIEKNIANITSKCSNIKSGNKEGKYFDVLDNRIIILENLLSSYLNNPLSKVSKNFSNKKDIQIHIDSIISDFYLTFNEKLLAGLEMLVSNINTILHEGYKSLTKHLLYTPAYRSGLMNRAFLRNDYLEHDTRVVDLVLGNSYEKKQLKQDLGNPAINDGLDTNKQTLLSAFTFLIEKEYIKEFAKCCDSYVGGKNSNYTNVTSDILSTGYQKELNSTYAQYLEEFKEAIKINENSPSTSMQRPKAQRPSQGRNIS